MCRHHQPRNKSKSSLADRCSMHRVHPFFLFSAPRNSCHVVGLHRQNHFPSQTRRLVNGPLPRLWRCPFVQRTVGETLSSRSLSRSSSTCRTRFVPHVQQHLVPHHLRPGRIGSILRACFSSRPMYWSCLSSSGLKEVQIHRSLSLCRGFLWCSLQLVLVPHVWGTFVVLVMTRIWWSDSLQQDCKMPTELVIVFRDRLQDRLGLYWRGAFLHPNSRPRHNPCLVRACEHGRKNRHANNGCDNGPDVQD